MKSKTFMRRLETLRPQARTVYDELRMSKNGVSAAQIRTIYGIQNPGARIAELRAAGAKIKSVELTTRRGVRYVLA